MLWTLHIGLELQLFADILSRVTLSTPGFSCDSVPGSHVWLDKYRFRVKTGASLPSEKVSALERISPSCSASFPLDCIYWTF